MKKCPKCKMLWPNETKFCGKCGTNLEHAEIVTEEKVVPVKEKTETKQIVLSEKVTTTRKKSSSKVKKIIVAVLVLAVLIAGGGAVIQKVSSSNSNPYVYLSNGKFYLVWNAEKNEPIEIPAGETEDYLSASITFSKDEKYLYVLSDYDYEKGTGDLYQCQYKKLKKNSSKNEKYCKLIATDIYPDYAPMDGGKVVYKSNDDTVYYYNGKEPERLQTQVNRFYCTDDQSRIACECGSYDEGYTLYIVPLNKSEEKTEVISEYAQMCSIQDFDNIYYYANRALYSEEAYLTGLNRDAEYLGLICKGMYLPLDGVIYYEQDNGENYNIDDLITDSRGETEALQTAREGLGFEDSSEEGVKSVKMSKEGESHMIDDKVYSDFVHYYGNTLLYASLNDFNPIDLAEIQEDEDFIQNVEEKIELEFLEAGIHLVSGDNEAIVTGDAAKDLLTMIENDEYGMRIYMNETDVLAYSNGQVVAAKINKGKVSAFELLEDAEDIIAVDKTAIYYTTNKQEDEFIVYYDMNAYHNGKSKCVAEHVGSTLFDVYEDGKIVAHTDYDDGYDLSMIDSKGKEELIGKDAGGYIRCDKNTILYRSGKDLWLYKNGKTNYLASGVTWMWSRDSMEKEVQWSLAG